MAYLPDSVRRALERLRELGEQQILEDKARDAAINKSIVEGGRAGIFQSDPRNQRHGALHPFNVLDRVFGAGAGALGPVAESVTMKPVYRFFDEGIDLAGAGAWQRVYERRYDKLSEAEKKLYPPEGAPIPGPIIPFSDPGAWLAGGLGALEGLREGLPGMVSAAYQLPASALELATDKFPKEKALHGLKRIALKGAAAKEPGYQAQLKARESDPERISYKAQAEAMRLPGGELAAAILSGVTSPGNLLGYGTAKSLAKTARGAIDVAQANRFMADVQDVTHALHRSALRRSEQFGRDLTPRQVMDEILSLGKATDKDNVAEALRRGILDDDEASTIFDALKRDTMADFKFGLDAVGDVVIPKKWSIREGWKDTKAWLKESFEVKAGRLLRGDSPIELFPSNVPDEFIPPGYEVFEHKFNRKMGAMPKGSRVRVVYHPDVLTSRWQAAGKTMLPGGHRATVRQMLEDPTFTRFWKGQADVLDELPVSGDITLRAIAGDQSIPVHIERFTPGSLNSSETFAHNLRRFLESGRDDVLDPQARKALLALRNRAAFRGDEVRFVVDRGKETVAKLDSDELKRAVDAFKEIGLTEVEAKAIVNELNRSKIVSRPSARPKAVPGEPPVQPLKAGRQSNIDMSRVAEHINALARRLAERTGESVDTAMLKVELVAGKLVKDRPHGFFTTVEGKLRSARSQIETQAMQRQGGKLAAQADKVDTLARQASKADKAMLRQWRTSHGQVRLELERQVRELAEFEALVKQQMDPGVTGKTKKQRRAAGRLVKNKRAALQREINDLKKQAASQMETIKQLELDPNQGLQALPGGGTLQERVNHELWQAEKNLQDLADRMDLVVAKAEKELASLSAPSRQYTSTRKVVTTPSGKTIADMRKAERALRIRDSRKADRSRFHIIRDQRKQLHKKLRAERARLAKMRAESSYVNLADEIRELEKLVVQAGALGYDPHIARKVTALMAKGETPYAPMAEVLARQARERAASAKQMPAGSVPPRQGIPASDAGPAIPPPDIRNITMPEKLATLLTNRNQIAYHIGNLLNTPMAQLGRLGKDLGDDMGKAMMREVIRAQWQRQNFESSFQEIRKLLPDAADRNQAMALLDGKYGEVSSDFMARWVSGEQGIHEFMAQNRALMDHVAELVELPKGKRQGYYFAHITDPVAAKRHFHEQRLEIKSRGLDKTTETKLIEQERAAYQRAKDLTGDMNVLADPNYQLAARNPLFTQLMKRSGLNEDVFYKDYDEAMQAYLAGATRYIRNKRVQPYYERLMDSVVDPPGWQKGQAKGQIRDIWKNFVSPDPSLERWLQQTITLDGLAYLRVPAPIRERIAEATDPARLSKFFRNYAFLKFIGNNPSSAMINLTQTWFNTTNLMGQQHVAGGLLEAHYALRREAKGGQDAMLEAYRGGGRHASGTLGANQLDDGEVVQLSRARTQAGQLYEKGKAGAMEIGALMYSKAEGFNVLGAFSTGWHKTKKLLDRVRTTAPRSIDDIPEEFFDGVLMPRKDQLKSQLERMKQAGVHDSTKLHPKQAEVLYSKTLTDTQKIDILLDPIEEYRHAIRSEATIPLMSRKANDAANLTQFVYSGPTRPITINKLETLKALNQFADFTRNEMEFVARRLTPLAEDLKTLPPGKRAKVKKILMNERVKFYGALMAIGGPVAAIPFGEDLRQVEPFKPWLDHVQSLQEQKLPELMDWVTRQEPGTFKNWGTLSMFMQRDIGSRVSIGGLTTGDPIASIPREEWALIKHIYDFKDHPEALREFTALSEGFGTMVSTETGLGQTIADLQGIVPGDEKAVGTPMLGGGHVPTGRKAVGSIPWPLSGTYLSGQLREAAAPLTPGAAPGRGGMPGDALTQPTGALAGLQQALGDIGGLLGFAPKRDLGENLKYENQMAEARKYASVRDGAMQKARQYAKNFGPVEAARKINEESEGYLAITPGAITQNLIESQMPRLVRTYSRLSAGAKKTADENLAMLEYFQHQAPILEAQGDEVGARQMEQMLVETQYDVLEHMYTSAVIGGKSAHEVRAQAFDLWDQTGDERFLKLAKRNYWVTMRNQMRQEMSFERLKTVLREEGLEGLERYAATTENPNATRALGMALFRSQEYD